MKCSRCSVPAVLALPSHNAGFCQACFQIFVHRQVEKAIDKWAMLAPGEPVLLAISGGKDSLALAHILKQLGHDVRGLHVDLAIPGSSAPARAAVEAFCQTHDVPLTVVELAREGLAIPDVKARLRRPICSACGKIKRHVFNREALRQGVAALATGHNLDDEASRLFANTLRWDVAYLSDQGPRLEAEDGFARKIKPLFRLGEFETAAYCFLNDITYHMGACPYSQGASFTGHKKLLADLERTSPGQKLKFYLFFLERGREAFRQGEAKSGPSLSPCLQCGMPTVVEVCGVCRIRDAVAQRD